jgi:cysteine desulfurase
MMIYLDYSANTPASHKVLETYLKAEETYIGNANSEHAAGRQAAKAIEEASEKIASLCGVSPEELIFTSGATEANNLAIKGIAASSRHVGKHIISTGLEHSSVSASLSWLQAQGYEIDLCPLGRDGKIDLEEFEELIREDTCLVSVSAVDSELGIEQPLKEIQAIVRKHPKCRMHIDATQAVGKVPFDFSLGDTISFAPHKFYGLNGIGVLIKRKDVSLEPQMHGGHSTSIYRSGTPVTGLILSVVPALEDALGNLQENLAKVQALNARLRQNLQDLPQIRINSTKDSIPHIFNLGLVGTKGVEMQKKLDEAGICVSVKSACSSDLLPSKAVFTITRDKKRSYESFRISISPFTKEAEIDELSDVLHQIAEGEN